MTRTLMLCACLFTANLAAGCDHSDDAETEYRDQVSEADITLEEAIDPLFDQTEAVVLDVSFELGVDDGFYLVETVLDDVRVVYEVDARTGERAEAERTRADDERRELARRHRELRRRLAQLVREIRAEREGERAVRARLLRDEVEVETMDRRGRRHAIRRRLAAAEDRPEDRPEDRRGR